MQDIQLGWILPNGQFVACQHGQHSQIAATILHAEADNKIESIVETLGWIKITKCSGFPNPFICFTTLLTQSQIDTLHDWCTVNHYPYKQLVGEMDSF